MDPGSQETMAAASQERPDFGGNFVERRKSQRRAPPPLVDDSGSFRFDDRRLCRGRRWDDWKRA